MVSKTQTITSRFSKKYNHLNRINKLRKEGEKTFFAVTEIKSVEIGFKKTISKIK